MVAILAVDPGLTTGVVRAVAYGPDEVSVLEWKQLSQPEFHEYAWNAISKSLRSMIVVCESWVQRPGYRTNQPQALELIGFLRGFCQLHGNPFYLQTSADAKEFGTDERLKHYAIRAKERHARDALRHALLWSSSHLRSGNGNRE